MGGRAVITTAHSAVIGASRARVWRAITDPDEVLGWDEPVLGLVDAADGYPSVGRPVRWRYHLGPVPILMRDRPLEIVPEEHLRSAVSLGLFRFHQTWSLRENGGPARTTLGLRIAAGNSIPVLGGRVDRFDVRRLASGYADAKLRSLQRWCEAVLE